MREFDTNLPEKESLTEIIDEYRTRHKMEAFHRTLRSHGGAATKGISQPRGYNVLRASTNGRNPSRIIGTTDTAGRCSPPFPFAGSRSAMRHISPRMVSAAAKNRASSSAWHPISVRAARSKSMTGKTRSWVATERSSWHTRAAGGGVAWRADAAGRAGEVREVECVGFHDGAERRCPRRRRARADAAAGERHPGPS